MQKYVNLVDLVKSFPTNIYLQKSASIKPRTGPSKFGGENFISLFICPLKRRPGEGRGGHREERREEQRAAHARMYSNLGLNAQRSVLNIVLYRCWIGICGFADRRRIRAPAKTGCMGAKS